MSDTHGTDSTSTPHIEVLSEAPPMKEFDKQLESFLGSSMLADDAGEDAVSAEPAINPPPPPPPAVTTDATGAPALTPPPASAPQGAAQHESGAGNQTGNVTVSVAPPVVDPSLVIEMMGFGNVTAPAAAPAPAHAAAAPPPSSPPADDNAPFSPFRPDFVLPQELSSALFEAEDSATRSKALVGLLSSALNTACQTMDERFKSYHAPRIVQAMEQRQTATATQHAFVEEFYSENGGAPDLRPYGTIVKRAIEVIGARDPNVPWTQAKPLVMALARQVVAQLGGPAPPSAAPPRPAPAAKPQHEAFLAGGARPAGVGDPADPNTPAGVLAGMLEFG